MDDAVFLLAFNGGLQVLVSSLLGSLMLLPMQPWGNGLRDRIRNKVLLPVHLDLYMLAFMQWGAAFLMTRYPQVASTAVAWALIFGGWTNPMPYLVRGFGINAFALAGPTKQRIAASIAGLSVLAILWAWSSLLVAMWPLR